jgi:hypothetical protein
MFLGEEYPDAAEILGFSDFFVWFCTGEDGSGDEGTDILPRTLSFVGAMSDRISFHLKVFVLSLTSYKTSAITAFAGRTQSPTRYFCIAEGGFSHWKTRLLSSPVRMHISSTSSEARIGPELHSKGNIGRMIGVISGISQLTTPSSKFTIILTESTLYFRS